MKGRYERDLNDKFALIDEDERVGWQASNGGYAVVNRLQPWPMGYGSSPDSPAKDQPWQFENDAAYPWSHWLYLPYGHATVFYQAKDNTCDISITLRAESDNMEQDTGCPAERMSGRFYVGSGLRQVANS